jgi:16S rRNA (guanine(527)-N(7))-methyltransferase RsmG
MRSADALIELLEESAILQKSEAGEKLVGYLSLLEKWNTQINLTSSTEWRVLGPMFREGIWAASRYDTESVYHLDIGSGGGFPGILLKIMVPRMELDMVEVRQKKCRFLETVVHTLGLEGVRVHASLLSEFLQGDGDAGLWDCISWKGIKLSTADLVRLRRHCHPQSRLWMFHGQNAATEEQGALDREFVLVRKESVPGMRDSNLSAYQPLLITGYGSQVVD